MKHLGLWSIIVYTNDDPGMTLICFTTRSNFETGFYSAASMYSPFYFHTPQAQAFLAHLSRRLIGELIVYPWSGVCPSVAGCRWSTMLKHLLLRNRLADQSQILCEASLGRGNEILFTASGSHDQDGRHAHIW